MLSLTVFPKLSALPLLASVEIILAAAFIYLIGWVIYSRHFHPYSDIPGPFWASISNWWYFTAVRDAKPERYQHAIHEKYGPVVRLSPHEVQIAHPEALDVIYGAKHKFTKTDFYDSFKPSIPGAHHRDLFTDRDEDHHTIRRKLVAPIFAQGSVLELEPRINDVIELFCKQMDTFSGDGSVFDMSIWFRKYTFDVIGTLFYGKDGGFGFIRENIDYNGWMHLLDTMVPPVSSLSYIPKGLRTLYMISQMVYSSTRTAMTGFGQVQVDAVKAVKERLDFEAAGNKVTQPDMLSKMLEIVREKGEKFDYTTGDVATELWSNIWAGSDTTAFSLAAIMYHLLKNPDKFEKLLSELEAAFASGSLSEPVRYLDAVKLPYLRACVTEAMRMNPALGSMLPRMVPKGGVMIADRFFPGGYRVGMNAIVIQSDKSVFGPDADQFVPERWTRVGEKEANNMERHLMNFGYGTRICVGKHITMTEMYKLLPTVFRRYHIELVDPAWKVKAGWFSVPTHIMVRVHQRRPGSRRAV